MEKARKPIAFFLDDHLNRNTQPRNTLCQEALAQCAKFVFTAPGLFVPAALVE